MEYTPICVSSGRTAYLIEIENATNYKSHHDVEMNFKHDIVEYVGSDRTPAVYNERKDVQREKDNEF